MSFSHIRPYFQSVLPTVDADLKEWVDGFDWENIPESIIDKAWHLTFNPVAPDNTNQNCLKTDYPISLNVFLEAGKDVASGIDSANILGQSIYQECLKHSNRLGITGTSVAKVTNIEPGNMSINPLSASNNNTIRIQIDFTFKIIIELS